MSEIWLRTGEATVLAADGEFTDAMPEVMIGHVKGPVGHAFSAMAGQAAGHPRMFIIRDHQSELGDIETSQLSEIPIASDAESCLIIGTHRTENEWPKSFKIARGGDAFSILGCASRARSRHRSGRPHCTLA